MRNYLFLIALAFGSTLAAQRSVVITPDADVLRVLDVFAQVSERKTSIDGWRVQVLATTDRQRLELVHNQFKASYPSVPVDWVHNKPYYKLRAGAFVTKAEADRLRQTLSEQFEGVYLVKDNVSESELLRMY